MATGDSNPGLRPERLRPPQDRIAVSRQAAQPDRDDAYNQL